MSDKLGFCHSSQRNSMSIERQRKRFDFWLDTNKSDEFDLANTIDELKKKRQFIKTLRQAFALIMSLRCHDTSVLLSLFPWVSEELATQTDHIGRLEALAQQFENMITSPRPHLVETSSVLIANNLEKPPVTENMEARKELAIKNTLAALNDF